ncbi:ABC transporter permease subunit [Paenibacillus sp. WQ 127069]|uniref:ABC transporter permease subunit n=1 Tax=Paenibacillus baimaensis TaxID=2982185 RepID=A0ABT2URT6_9BACL|nr:ABC transporter permease subunit [Paenibacillus sp. WQ 127069]MCU6797340.1 ABC transporter permease subunit [Paenibacillus sp. WQ 127069]
MEGVNANLQQEETRKGTGVRPRTWWKDLRQDYDLYLLLLPGLIVLLLFKYTPMFGVVIAFKDYNLFDGIWGSPWAGFTYFEELFANPKFYTVLVNTLLINLYKLVFQFPLPIILALMINEVRHLPFKRVTQTITYLPHFLSWVIISAIFINLLSPETGILREVFALFGMQHVLIIADERFFRSLLVVSAAWKETGWSSIIYLSAIVSIDPQQYEAAKMDGAGKLRQIWHVTLPGIRSVIVFIIMLRIGHALSNDLEQVLMFYSPLVYNVGDVIGTFVYRVGLGEMKYSFTTAIGLFQSLIAMILIITANAVSKKFGERSLW